MQVTADSIQFAHSDALHETVVRVRSSSNKFPFHVNGAMDSRTILTKLGEYRVVAYVARTKVASLGLGN